MKDISGMQRAARALQPITLPLARKALVAFSAILAALLVMTIVAVVPKNPILGSLSIVFLALLLWLSLLMLRRGRTFLDFDTEQLTQSFGIYKITIRWADIRQVRIGWFEFEAVQIPWNRKVFVDYERNNRKIWMAIAPPMFGVNAEQMVDLLMPFFGNVQRTRNPDAGPTTPS